MHGAMRRYRPAAIIAFSRQWNVASRLYRWHMWRPATEEDLIEASSADLLRESHLLELKSDLGTEPRDRSETARDLASMALDGGQIIFGIAELKAENRFALSPISLAGKVEALEQIAELRIEPPLVLRASEIVISDDSSLGYLVVDVEASPVAPHMVDGVYYGRGEKRRRRLGDAEVLRLHRGREDEKQAVKTMLEASAWRDRIDGRQQGHLHIVALPVAASTLVAEQVVWDAKQLREIVMSAELPDDLHEWAPSVGYAHRFTSREHGSAFTSFPDEGSTERVAEYSALDIEFREDGSIHVFVGRLTDGIGRNVNDERRGIMDGLVLGYMLRVLQWAVVFGDSIRHTGAWDFGIAGDRMAGAPAYSTAGSWPSSNSKTYPAPSYESLTRATRSELIDHPEQVLSRLLSRFVRTLGLEMKYGHLLGW